MKANATLLIARGAVASLPPEIRQQVEEAAEAIREVIQAHPEGVGELALGLVGAEIAAEQED